MRTFPYRLSAALFGGFAALLFLLGLAPAARANVYATNLRLNGGLTNVPVPLGGSSVTINYLLNEPASSGVAINIKSGNTVVRTISLSGGGAGTFQGPNSVVWDGKDNASNSIAGGTYTISITAATPGYFDWTQISEDSNPGNYVNEAGGIAVNRNTNSPYYGRIFVGNATFAFGVVPGDVLGIQKFNADGSTPADGGLSTGGWPWTGGFKSPWKLEVSPDDFVYINDRSSNGLVLRFDQTLTTNSRTYALRSDNWPNAGATSLSGLAVTGTGTNSQIWMADAKSPGGTGVVRWAISASGVVATNDVGTTIVQAGAGLNLSVAPYDLAVDYSNRVYVIQFRTNSADSAYRVLRFSTTNGVVATNADWKIGNGDDDLRGASGIAVNPAATLVAVAFVGVGDDGNRTGGAVRLFNAANGTELLILGPGGNHDHSDVAWDNVGNLYLCDNWDSIWRIFSPPGTNGATTVAVTTVQVAFPTPPILSAPVTTNNQFQFTLTGQANVTYVIQSSTNLQNWISVATNAQAPASRTILLPAPASQSFYRAFSQ